MILLLCWSNRSLLDRSLETPGLVGEKCSIFGTGVVTSQSTSPGTAWSSTVGHSRVFEGPGTCQRARSWLLICRGSWASCSYSLASSGTLRRGTLVFGLRGRFGLGVPTEAGVGRKFGGSAGRGRRRVKHSSVGRGAEGRSKPVSFESSQSASNQASQLRIMQPSKIEHKGQKRISWSCGSVDGDFFPMEFGCPSGTFWFSPG